MAEAAMKILLALFAIALLGAGQSATEIRGMKHPALSPDGKRIAFDWHGDIWVCPVEGGTAERLTDDPADEEKPAWSPDGKEIAFSSDRAGNRDIFVLTLESRAIRQLTFHSSDDDSPAWSPDGKWIAFQSTRDSNLDLPLNNNVWDIWKAPARGGTATRVTRFRGENPAWSPDGKWIAYDRYSSGYADGEHNIFLISPDGAGLPVELASGSEDTRHPVFKGITVYFSHEANGIQTSGFRNVWRASVAGGALVQVTGHRGGQVTWPTTCERSDSLVYEYEFDLYSIDLRKPRPRKLSITTDFHFEDPPVAKKFTSGFHSPAWSLSGSAVAFTCHGELWSASIEGGDARRLTEGLDEARDPSWSSDGHSIVYCAGPASMPSHLYRLDLKSGVRTQLTSEAGGYRSPRLSPDGRTVLVTRQENETSRLWLVREGGATPFAPSGEAEESAGCFSPDGQSIAFLRSRGGKSEIVVAGLDGSVQRRFEAQAGSKRDLDWSPDGSRLGYAVRSSNGRWLAGTVRIDGVEPRLLEGSAVSVRWSPDSTMLLCETDSRGQRETEKLRIVDATGNSRSLAIDLSATRPTKRHEEMLAVFRQVYGSYVGNYYDPFFHGVDMPSLRAKYEPFAGACRTKAELYILINDMIKELHSSHIHLTPAPVKNTVVTGGLGVDLERGDGGVLLVRQVEAGSPAEKAGIHPGDAIVGNGKDGGPDWDLDRWLSGDRLREASLEVRDSAGTSRIVTVKPIDRTALRELKYDNTIARRKEIVRQRSGGRLAYHHIRMMAAAEVQRLKSHLERECVGAVGLILDERDGVGGLAHQPVCALLDSTAPDRLNAFPACSMRNRDGSTVVDKYRQGQAGGRSSGKSWDKPVIMIQNSISRSDKEILPYTFRHLGIGYLVGMPTAGGVIGGSDWTMQDGSRITVSTQGWFTMDGRNMEGWGVPPDFRVPETHEDLYAGRDAQLEKAIEVLLAQIDGKIAPPRRPGAQEGKPKAAPAPSRLEQDVRALSSAEFEGRETGTDGEKKAASYLVKRLKESGLQPEEQEFLSHGGGTGRNVLAIVRGKSDEAVVVGAHYDHLGMTHGELHPGADDNASGTAVLLDLASRFSKRPAGRTIVLVFFSGEESGCFGSRYYVNHPAVPLDKTVAMINMDMVGRLKESLTLFGADTGDRFRDYLSESKIKIAFSRDPGGQSDHTSFQMKRIPAVHVFTGSHPDYHKSGDTAEKLNFQGMRQIADLVETLARRIADTPERMKLGTIDLAAPTPRVKGAVPYFGSMPDYGYDGKGVKLAGVAPGSPAEKAGLREGDVIVLFNGHDVADVKEYSALLFSRRPGEEITLVYEREGKKADAKATLGARRPKEDE